MNDIGRATHNIFGITAIIGWSVGGNGTKRQPPSSCWAKVKAGPKEQQLAIDAMRRMRPVLLRRAILVVFELFSE